MERIATSFGSVAYREVGEGPTALFVHGVLMNGSLWDGVVAEVSSERRCLLPDLMGHGETEGESDEESDQAARHESLLHSQICRGHSTRHVPRKESTFCT